MGAVNKNSYLSVGGLREKKSLSDFLHFRDRKKKTINKKVCGCCG
jgi:hypothetical protein